MHCKLESENEKISGGFNHLFSDKNFYIIKTIKSISEDIIKKDRNNINQKHPKIERNRRSPF